MTAAKRISVVAALAVFPLLLSGCVAVNVGEPEVFTHSETVVTTGKTPVRSEVVSVEAKAQMEGNRLKAWLEADLRDEYQRFQHDETVTVKKQRKLAMGLFPGAAPAFLAPPESLVVDRSTKPVYVIGQTLGNLAFLGIPLVLGTLNTILVEPISNSGWVKNDIVADKQSYRFSGILSGLDTPKLSALRKFTPNERMAMRLSIPGSQPPIPGKRRGIGMWGLLGFYKYNDVVVTGPLRAGLDSMAASETKQRTETVGGPYEVELRVAGTDISSTAQVGARESNAVFNLPQVERGGQYEAVLTFRSLYSGADAVKSAWQTRTLAQWVWLQEKPKPKPVVAYTPPQAPVREEVKEIHHYHETRVVEERKPEGAPWEIETLEAFRGGRAVYRVTIRDASKKAFEVEREVRPEIERNLREAFVASMPGLDERWVKAHAVADYEGRAIRFRGVAFSVQPLTDGWRYDADTHRGSVRLRISEGMSPDEAKRWARENIEAIVKEKNVALEAGTEPPSGAMYRSLGESLENGVLTVEFEAVE